MNEASKRLDEATDYLEAKKKEFELLKIGFDGFDLKGMDNKIKEIMEMIQRGKSLNEK